MNAKRCLTGAVGLFVGLVWGPAGAVTVVPVAPPTADVAVGQDGSLPLAATDSDAAPALEEAQVAFTDWTWSIVDVTSPPTEGQCGTGDGAISLSQADSGTASATLDYHSLTAGTYGVTLQVDLIYYLTDGTCVAGQAQTTVSLVAQ